MKKASHSDLIELSHSEETERAVLAAVLLRPEIFCQICGPLRREHFYLETHRILWDAFERLVKVEGEEVNLRTLQATLEDGPRRLKSRLAKVAPEAPEALELATDWPRVDEGCLATLGAYVTEHSPRCVLIDTLARVRPREDRSRDKYQADYESLAGLQRLAIESGFAMIVIHHTRKADASDFLDAVSGTAGLTAAADSIAVLRRARSEAAAILEVTGRDVEERSFALQLDGEALTWTLLGDGEEYALSQERREILEHLRSLGGERAWPKAIAEALGKPEKIESIKKLCRRLQDDGQIQRDSRGYFAAT